MDIMEATIRLTLDELTPVFIEELKGLFKNDQAIKLIIEPINDFGLNKKEAKEEYLKRINQVLKNLEKGKSVSFSEAEFDEFSEALVK